MSLGAILIETRAEECRGSRFVLTFEAFPTVEPGQMAERDAVALASRQVGDKRSEQSCSNAMTPEARMDLHTPKHESALLLRPADNANRASVVRRHIDAVCGSDPALITTRAI